MNIKSKIWKSIVLISLVFLFTLTACKKDQAVLDSEISDIDSFIWRGLKQYYLWVDKVPNLVNPNLDDENQLAYFLNSYNEDHEALFYDLLYDYGSIDKWSWIVDDYVALENYFQGTTTSMGFEYGLVQINGTNSLFGFIQYVVPESPAAEANLTRGEIFTQIDGQALTISNYRDLLFSNSSFTISFADIIDNTLISNGKIVDLTATVVNENPIHYSEIKDVDGVKVAYLVYNGFTSLYDFELNDLFSSYKTEGVQELILDLRYNGGGSVRTTTYLASMIFGTDTQKIFSRSQYNDILQEYLEAEYGSSFFDNTFLSEIEAVDDIPQAPINTLNLTRLYVLTTKGTASASELIINGLNPYMDVVIIGTNTHGKYVGSMTIKDYDASGKINSSHKWAMQPITFKTTNSEGYSDFVNGFAPTFFVDEDFGNLLPFGDENDPLFKAALDHIKGITPSATTKSILINTFIESKDIKRFGREMYRN